MIWIPHIILRLASIEISYNHFCALNILAFFLEKKKNHQGSSPYKDAVLLVLGFALWWQNGFTIILYLGRRSLNVTGPNILDQIGLPLTFKWADQSSISEACVIKMRGAASSVYGHSWYCVMWVLSVSYSNNNVGYVHSNIGYVISRILIC